MYPRRVALLLIVALFIAPLLRGHRRIPASHRCPSIRAAVVIIHATFSLPRGTRHFPVSQTTACTQLKSRIEETKSRISRDASSPPRPSPGRSTLCIQHTIDPCPLRAVVPLRC